MCGIFACVVFSENAHQIAFEGIKKLEYRGYDSWGISYIPLITKKIITKKHTGKIGGATLPRSTKSNIAIAHTRWATHGGVLTKNAHPHLDCTNRISVIHNGIVENYKILKNSLTAKGHEFMSDTDSEVIAHAIESNSNTSFPLAVFNTFKTLTGSNAICAMDLKSQTIVACRNGSPLVVGFDEAKKQYYIGSDVPAFLKHTKTVYFLEDNEGVIISHQGFSIWDLKNKRQKSVKLTTLDWKIEDAEKSSYPHFLLKEIYEQKITTSKTADINLDRIKKISHLIGNCENLILTGCGTAAYCALAGKYFFANSKIKTDSLGAYEILPFQNSINSKSIVIGISQSGETADTLEALKKAKDKGATVVGILNARGSAMERLSDYTLNVAAGPEIAVVTTKAYLAQLSTLYLLAKASEGRLADGVKNIRYLQAKLNGFINRKLEKDTLKISKKLAGREHIYTIGKHLNYPAALEFALKIKESACIHSEAFSAGELKHGVITLIQKGTPCITLLANDDVKAEVLNSASELKARGARIIGIGPKRFSEFDDYIKTPDLGELSIFSNVIVGQLIGYQLGVLRGFDPDKPRNLAKSVTVK